MKRSARPRASWRRVGLLLLLAVSAHLPSAGAAEGLSLTLEAGDRKIGQGAPFAFRAVVTNQSEDTSARSVITFVLSRVGGDRSIDALRWSEVVAPGGKATYRGSLAPSAWFAETGRYVLRARSADVSGSIRFEVAPSTVRIPRFKDVTGSAGLSSPLLPHECGTWAAGAAWGDVDGDRDLDLYVGGGTGGAPARLWINNAGRFTDQASERGISPTGGIGAVFADYDNDGDQDLYVTEDGGDWLYRNAGDGTFVDVTAEAGVAVPGASQSATWADLDADGHLDLYVTNHGPCESGEVSEDTLFHNNGDGTFTDRTEWLEFAGSTKGAGFQMTFFDYDSDGDLDAFLANDYWGPQPHPNLMWRNDGVNVDGGIDFANVSRGVEVGVPMNSMGVALGDYDRDLDLDLAVSNIRRPVLFQNQGGERFAQKQNYARVTRDYHDASSIAITWGTLFADLNNDGWEDLYFASGRLAKGELGTPEGDVPGDHVFQPNELFTNGHHGRFLDHSAPSRSDDTGISRGVASADYDRDGRVDLFVVNQDGTPRLYRNVTSSRGVHWLQVDTVGTASNRDGCGARVIATVGRAKMLRQVMCGGSSLATGSDSTVHFGLGKQTRVDTLRIEWPSGKRQVLRNVRVDHLLKVTEPA